MCVMVCFARVSLAPMTDWTCALCVCVYSFFPSILFSLLLLLLYIFSTQMDESEKKLDFLVPFIFQIDQTVSFVTHSKNWPWLVCKNNTVVFFLSSFFLSTNRFRVCDCINGFWYGQNWLMYSSTNFYVYLFRYRLVYWFLYLFLIDAKNLKPIGRPIQK